MLIQVIPCQVLTEYDLDSKAYNLGIFFCI